MISQLKYGIIAGIIIFVLNICGGSLIGAFNNCIALLTVLTAAGIVGFITGRKEEAEKVIKIGALGGGIIGLFSLISQIIGHIIGVLIGILLLQNINHRVDISSPAFLMGAGVSGIASLFITIIVALVLIIVGAGVGAMTAKIVSDNKTKL